MRYDIDRYQSELQQLTARQILAHVAEKFDRFALSFSGAEDVILIDMACKLELQPCVFTLDTGRLHPETYRYLEQVRKHYAINLDIMQADAAALEAFVKAKGLFSFYEDGHQECCAIRKVEPLRRKLATVDAWVTGQRRDQSPTRSTLSLVEQDVNFGDEAHPLVKFNPLANWTSEQVWAYIDMHNVPFNPLHLQGMISIGCEPCTRPTQPHQHERAGRWWWEDATKRECGLHVKKD